MRFIIDAQLPPALARWLTAQGHEAEHVFDVGLAEASDAVIAQRAVDLTAIAITKDEDFVLRAHMGATGPPIVWVRYGNVRRAELIRRFGMVWPSVAEALARGEALVELFGE